MDESINIVLGDSFRYALGTFYVDVLQIKISAPVRFGALSGFDKAHLVG